MERFKLAILVVLITSITYGSAEAKKRNNSLTDFAVSAIKDSLVKAPQDQEVCFSPDEPCDVKLIKFVESAKESIDVAIYDINLDQLVHQLLVQSKSIPVRIIADKRQAKGNHSLVDTLIKAGANVRYGHQRGIFHNKFTIVDSKMIETGSFNYTNHAAESNNENQYYSTTPKVVERYKNHFEQLWSEATPASN